MLTLVVNIYGYKYMHICIYKNVFINSFKYRNIMAKFVYHSFPQYYYQNQRTKWQKYCKIIQK